MSRATLSVAAVALTATFAAGCSSSPSGTEAKPSASDATTEAPKPKAADAPPKSAAVPTLLVGQSGTYTARDSATDVKTKMQVTVKAAKYVTPEEVNTSNKPKGQYLRLTLTVKNVGKAAGEFSAYGKITWEDVSTAAQPATTLESTGGPELDTTYKPGQAVTGDVVLDVLRKGGTLSYADGVDGASFKVTLPS
ncbi:DUF4352 domain-containing protein [Streptomyces varsoviensis]|uniref:DUF4352 domain-containing protein n=1 Tax=Streptomyces varsoviensis TaxID=67373 RepID=UPI0033F246BC